jgi:hypothetical protein
MTCHKRKRKSIGNGNATGERKPKVSRMARDVRLVLLLRTVMLISWNLSSGLTGGVILLSNANQTAALPACRLRHSRAKAGFHGGAFHPPFLAQCLRLA